jgi:transcriptional regulator with XRE-family HTH domain
VVVLGKRVAGNTKALRLSRGFSQKDLAERTGLTIRYISRLENTAPNVTLEVIEKLTKGLNCSVADIFGVEAYRKPPGAVEILDQTIQLLEGLRSRF